MKATRAAVVGCGVISAEHLSFLAESSDIDLVGVCDLSPAVADFTATRFGTRSFTDTAMMLAEARPDVLHVLTPPLSHDPIARQALDAGCHVVCEKPLTPTPEATSALLEYAEQQDRFVIESHNYRFNDQIAVIEALKASGRLGEIVSVTVNVSLNLGGGRLVDPNMPSPVSGLPGGAVHDFLPHQAYLALHLLGYPEPGRVAAHWRNVGGNPQARFDEYDAVVEFGDQSVARFSVNARTRPDSFRVIAQGTEGGVEVEIFQSYVRVDAARGGSKLAGLLNNVAGGAALVSSGFVGLRGKVLRHTPYHGMANMLRQTYDALATGSTPPITRRHIESTAVLVDDLIKAGQ